MLNTLSLGNKSSPPLIFLHGLLGSAKDFMPMMNKLQPYFYCVAMDLPGHGSSPLLTSLSFAVTLEAILTTMYSLSLSKASFIGYSLGGRLSMLLHYYYPAYVEQAVILSAHPGLLPEERAQHRRIQQQWMSVLQQDLNTFLALWYSQPLFATLDPKYIITERCDVNATSILYVMDTLCLSKQPSMWHHIATSKTPLLFLYGEHDEKYRTLYSTLPPSIPKEGIVKASHALHLENPLACCHTIHQFLCDSRTLCPPKSA